MSSKSGAGSKGKQKPQSKRVQQGPTEKLRDRGQLGSKTPGAQKPTSVVKKEKKPNTE